MSAFLFEQGMRILRFFCGFSGTAVHGNAIGVLCRKCIYCTVSLWHADHLAFCRLFLHCMCTTCTAVIPDMRRSVSAMQQASGRMLRHGTVSVGGRLQ